VFLGRKKDDPLKEPIWGMIRKTFLYIFYNILILFMLAAGMEILLRITVPRIRPQGTDKNLYMENRFGESHGLRPSAEGLSNGALVQTDSWGFRRTSAAPDTSKDSWLLIGDSVTLGIGVESDSTFAGLLQSAVRDMNVLNSAMIGYNIDDYVNVSLQRMAGGHPFKIVRITLFWCLNDVFSDPLVRTIEMPGGRLRSVFGGILNVCRRRTRIYPFVKALFFDRPKSYCEFDSRFYEDAALLDRCVRKIVRIGNQCRERGMAFDVFLLPYEWQIRKRLTGALEPQARMMHTLEQAGIECHDPLKQLIGRGVKSRDLFLYGDGIHLSEAGHRIIAGYMLGRMR
jgi:hypothetical protein